ncbi:LOW QUALITY PROTEIN: RIB43A-like with coiled-coils protein 2, partial [Malurus melanocephalus]|uniref:LOW QUALITY PROTEIN: RIB43A-like with coiled-coils protein 2 n=1 Tax=Malurus melanocephalus TaxID=175006 RepID=UPI00254721C4
RPRQRRETPQRPAPPSQPPRLVQRSRPALRAVPGRRSRSHSDGPRPVRAGHHRSGHRRSGHRRSGQRSPSCPCSIPLLPPGAMHRPGPLRDLDEAAARELRQRRELLRRERIFNPRIRTIGVDKDALDAQVKEKKMKEAIEKARHEQFAHEMKKNDKLICLLDERQKNEIKEINRAFVEFHKNFQKPETRREFDLNDPQALKKDLPARVSDDDPRCSVSGMQKFEGEDINSEKRKKFQQEQLREWSLQQQKDVKNALADQKFEDDLYDKFRIELDRKIMEEQRKEEESRRIICTATKNFNKIQAAELDYKNELEKAQKIKDDMDEITSLLRGDLLNENPEQAIGRSGKHPVLVDRWKGMTQEQLMAIREAQKEQVQEKLRVREQERRTDAEWDRQRLQAARTLLLFERQQQRENRVQRQDLDDVNAVLSEEQKAKNIYLKEEAYSNIPTEAYYAQFNTTTR